MWPTWSVAPAPVLQGFSSGGWFGSVVIFLAEHGGERRGFSASWQWASVGTISQFGVTLTTQLSHEQLIDWGWRISYVLGLLVGPVGLYIRSHIDETPDFLEAERPQKVLITDLLLRHTVPLLLALAPRLSRTAPNFCSSISRGRCRSPPARAARSLSSRAGIS